MKKLRIASLKLTRIACSAAAVAVIAFSAVPMAYAAKQAPAGAAAKNSLTPTSSGAASNDSAFDAKIADFCGRAHLAKNAFSDCTQQMDAAQDDNQRVVVERQFALGNVEVDQPNTQHQ